MTRPILSVAVLVGIALGATLGAQDRGATSAVALRSQALEHHAKDDTPAALATLEQALRRWPNDPGLLAAQGQIYWRLLRTKSAEEALLQAARSPDWAAEAQYWLGRIYLFKGWQAEGAFPGWHEEVSYRPRAIAAFEAARALRPDWELPQRALAEIAAGPPATPPADAAVAALDRELAAMAKNPAAPRASVRKTIEARLALRPDPMSYAAAANLLLARNEDLQRAEEIALAGRGVGEQFIRENESSYKLDGKVQGSLARNRALFADLAGWAAYLQKRQTVAEERLAEAERLYRGSDVVNQLHLGQLSRDKGDLDTAREHYLNVLELAAATPAARDTARQALAGFRAAEGEDPAGFEGWLSATLDRRREERRRTLVGNMEGKPAPPLRVVDLQGHPVDLQAERGNVILLNFFSAW